MPQRWAPGHGQVWADGSAAKSEDGADALGVFALVDACFRCGVVHELAEFEQLHGHELVVAGLAHLHSVCAERGLGDFADGLEFLVELVGGG